MERRSTKPKRSIESYNPLRRATEGGATPAFTPEDIAEIEQIAGLELTPEQRDRLAAQLDIAAMNWRTAQAFEDKPTPHMLAKQYGKIAGRLRDYLTGIEAGQEPATRRLYKVLRAGDPPKVEKLLDAMRRGGFQAMAALEAGGDAAAYLQATFDGVAGRDVEAVKRLCQWADSLHRRYSGRPGMPTREPSAALTELAAALAFIWADTIKRPLGRSRAKPEGYAILGGPFIRFVGACVDGIAGSDAPDSYETLLHYFRPHIPPEPKKT